MKFAGVSYTPTSFLNLFTSSVFSTEVDKGTTLAMSVLLLLSCTYVWTFLSRAFARADLLGFCTTLPLNNEVGAGGNSYAKYPQISLVCCIRAINLGNKTMDQLRHDHSWIESITTWSFLIATEGFSVARVIAFFDLLIEASLSGTLSRFAWMLKPTASAVSQFTPSSAIKPLSNAYKSVRFSSKGWL